MRMRRRRQEEEERDERRSPYAKDANIQNFLRERIDGGDMRIERR